MLKISRGHYQEIPAFYSKELRKLVGEMLTVDPSLRITADKILGKERERERDEYKMIGMIIDPIVFVF